MSLRPDTHYFQTHTLAADSGDEPRDQSTAIAPGDSLRIKYQTLSPADEYAVRDGRTEPLDEEFHAVLTHDWRGSGTVTANGIVVKAAALVGPANVAEGRTYWHPDSDLCNRVATGPVQVHYTYNPARPNVLHLWSLDWTYLETLPVKSRAPMLDNDALKAASRATRRQIKRFTDHAQQLHHGDTLKALDDLSHNASEMDRVAVDLPLPSESRPAAAPVDGARHTQPPAFSAVRRDTGQVIDRTRLANRLTDEADAELLAVRAHRREATPAPACAYDPLDGC